MFKTRKVVIVGAGHVGSHVALSLIQSGEADDIVLIDILKEKAAAQALCSEVIPAGGATTRPMARAALFTLPSSSPSGDT